MIHEGVRVALSGSLPSSSERPIGKREKFDEWCGFDPSDEEMNVPLAIGQLRSCVSTNEPQTHLLLLESDFINGFYKNPKLYYSKRTHVIKCAGFPLLRDTYTIKLCSAIITLSTL